MGRDSIREGSRTVLGSAGSGEGESGVWRDGAEASGAWREAVGEEGARGVWLSMMRSTWSGWREASLTESSRSAWLPLTTMK